MTSVISISLGLLLLVFQPVLVYAQSNNLFSGRWESANQHFRLIIYRHHETTQILFYGQIETEDGHNQYVTRAENIRQNGATLEFNLPEHSVYPNSHRDIASAGHQSELPPPGQVDQSTSWWVKISKGKLKLDCAATRRKLCGIYQPVELYPIQ